MKTRRKDYGVPVEIPKPKPKPYAEYCFDFRLKTFNGCTPAQVVRGIDWVTSQIRGGKVQLDKSFVTSFDDHYGAFYSDRECDVQILYYPPAGIEWKYS
mmetsp:Transcript_2404/g.2689  ORF Transcript_2404/g.2689 Transcript_2404/m.2689 type:complete len:99 (+) Transcript_2404:40-336(+)